MNIEYDNKDKLLTIKINEEIDHHAVEKIRRRADYEIQRYMPKRVVFDFNNVSFMDSSGIGMVVGRYKLISMLGGELSMINVKENLYKIYNTFYRLDNMVLILAGDFEVKDILKEIKSRITLPRNKV